MATEIETGKGKQKEEEFDVEKVRQQGTWDGRFQQGKPDKWFCKCDGYLRRASCLTTTDVSSPHHGRKFWRCSKKRNLQCRFFLWTDEENEAKEWMSKYGAPAPDGPVTPKSKKKGDPWSNSKGAISKPKSRSKEPSDLDGNPGPSKRPVDVEELPEFENIDRSRKATKTTRSSTPRGASKHVLETAAGSLLTPETGKSKVATINARSRQSEDQSTPPRLEQVIKFDNEISDTTAAVLKLIQDENIDLKESTKILIGDAIDRALDSNGAEVKRYKKTISKLREKLDEKEMMLNEMEIKLDEMGQMLLHMGGADEPVELSD